MAKHDFIPVDLRDELRAAAKQATQNGDERCAKILQQVADYEGTEASSMVKEVGLIACAIQYPAAKEVLRLVDMNKMAGG